MWILRLYLDSMMNIQNILNFSITYILLSETAMITAAKSNSVERFFHSCSRSSLACNSRFVSPSINCKMRFRVFFGSKSSPLSYSENRVLLFISNKWRDTLGEVATISEWNRLGGRPSTVYALVIITSSHNVTRESGIALNGADNALWVLRCAWWFAWDHSTSSVQLQHMIKYFTAGLCVEGPVLSVRQDGSCNFRFIVLASCNNR